MKVVGCVVRLVWSLSVLALSGPACSQNPSTQDSGATMSQAIQAAREAVQKYDKSKDMDALRSAGEKLESVDLSQASTSKQRTELRLQVMSGWVALLARIDGALGSQPPESPLTRVTPRTPPGTRTYPPNVDPSQIADPKVRAEYEKDLEANQRKAEASQRYWDAKALDIELTEGTLRFVRRYYTTSPADQKELREIIAKAGLGVKRQRELVAPPKS